MMKPLMNYLDYFKKSNTAVKANVSISWSGAISIDELSNGTLSKANKQIVDQKNVIYLLIGENTQGKKAIDIGQTSKSLLERTQEHLRNGDYLEKYPNNQKVYCGRISANIEIDKDLLEQVEGSIIKNVAKTAEQKGFHMCNESKVKQCENKLIRCIKNNFIPSELRGVLRYFWINIK